MKLEFRHRTTKYSWPNEIELVRTTLTLEATYKYSADRKARSNVDFEALAQENNERQIREALYGDLESEWRRMLESPSYDLQVPVDMRIRMEEFGALLRSKLDKYQWT